MHDSARLPKSSDGPEVALRPARPDDAPFLFDLFRSARADEFAPLGWHPDRLSAFLRSQFEAQERDYMRRFPRAERSLVFRDGAPAGSLWVARLEDEIRLLDIIVAPEHRGAGIGTRLLRTLQDEARAANLPLRHMVASTNPRALHLYQRMGFRVTADAGSHLLMEWSALKSPGD